MISISKSFEWDMGHRVTNHESKCRNLHGHRYRIVIEITGPLQAEAGSSSQGMVLDFSKLKQLITTQIIDELDHSFMYWKADKILAAFAKANVDLKMHAVPFVPTAECIVQFLAEQLMRLFSKESPEISIISMRLFETPTSTATWKP